MAINQNPTETVEELETVEIQKLKETYEALQRLKENSDFQTVVLDGYLKDKAVEMTSLLAVPGMAGQRSTIFEALAAISHFENYLHMIENLGAPDLEDEDE